MNLERKMEEREWTAGPHGERSIRAVRDSSVSLSLTLAAERPFSLQDSTSELRSHLWPPQMSLSKKKPLSRSALTCVPQELKKSNKPQDICQQSEHRGGSKCFRLLSEPALKYLPRCLIKQTTQAQNCGVNFCCEMRKKRLFCVEL